MMISMCVNSNQLLKTVYNIKTSADVRKRHLIDNYKGKIVRGTRLSNYIKARSVTLLFTCVSIFLV